MDNFTPRNQLIADIAAGEADDAALARFRRIAKRDSDAWQSLALALHDELHMRHDLTCAIESSSQQARREIDRASAQANDKRESRIHTHTRRSMRTHRAWAAWSGWSVAAALLLAMLVIMPQTNRFDVEHDQSSVALTGYSAQQALDHYLEAGSAEGRVVSELPTVMVEARLLDDGRLEVLYLRQLLEREFVSEVYTMASDELGQPLPLRMNMDVFDPADSSL